MWSSCAEISPWTGRFYSLLDPSYAKNNIPIIASVSEHQPTTWSSFYFDLQLLVFMFPGTSWLLSMVMLYCLWSWLLSMVMLYCPWSCCTVYGHAILCCVKYYCIYGLVGLFFCFSKLTDQNIFIILYGLTSVYFAVSLCSTCLMCVSRDYYPTRV